MQAPIVVEALVRAGVRVSEFAPVAVTLADLLESAGARTTQSDVTQSSEARYSPIHASSTQSAASRVQGSSRA